MQNDTLKNSIAPWQASGRWVSIPFVYNAEAKEYRVEFFEKTPLAKIAEFIKTNNIVCDVSRSAESEKIYLGGVNSESEALIQSFFPDYQPQTPYILDVKISDVQFPEGFIDCNVAAGTEPIKQLYNEPAILVSGEKPIAFYQIDLSALHMAKFTLHVFIEILDQHFVREVV